MKRKTKGYDQQQRQWNELYNGLEYPNEHQSMNPNKPKLSREKDKLNPREPKYSNSNLPLPSQ